MIISRHCHFLHITQKTSENTRHSAFLLDYAHRHGGRIDYIHGMADAVALCSSPGRAALLMPEMNKRDLFPSIITSGVLPKKSFSIGPALDKRYYLECRKINRRRYRERNRSLP